MKIQITIPNDLTPKQIDTVLTVIATQQYALTGCDIRNERDEVIGRWDFVEDLSEPAAT